MHPLRHYILLCEANWEKSYKFGYRSWYLPSENRFVPVNAFGSHVVEVWQHPEEFGLSKDAMPEDRPEDRDADIMNAICSRGWVRVAGQDRNNPNKFMIFEGADLTSLLKTLKLFFYDQGGDLQCAAIKVRSLDGNGGQEYAFNSPEAIKAAVMRKELPAPFHMGADDALAA